MPLPIKRHIKLEAIIRAEAVRVTGPWPLNTEVIVYPWTERATMFGYSDDRLTDFKNRFAILREDLRKL